MSGRRLLEDGATEFEAKLLAAGRRDAPTRENRARIVAGLAVGAGLGTATGVGSAGASAAQTSPGWLSGIGRSVLLKVGIGSTVGAVAVWSAVSALRAPPEALAPPPPVTSAVTAASVPPLDEQAPLPEASSNVALDAPVAPEMRAPKRAATPASARDANELSNELSALEAARRALVSGNATRALALLDEYARKYSAPRLATEAAVLRIEALVARGDRARARQLGQQFLAKNPKGPYERRVRSLIEGREARD